MSSQRLDRILEARLSLMRRFEERMRRSPGVSDASPLGSGAPNRHGMPRLPVGQTETKKWPVLDLGVTPEVTPETFRLRIDGACRAPLTLGFEALLELPQVSEPSDFHCVTAWSRFDLGFEGVRVAELLARVEPDPEAVCLLCHGSDGYTTNVALEEALKPDVLLAHRVDGQPLPREHGGPLRMVTPQLYAWKGAKWIQRIEILTEHRLGFWEERGYSSSAHPWRNDRYG